MKESKLGPVEAFKNPRAAGSQRKGAFLPVITQKAEIDVKLNGPSSTADAFHSYVSSAEEKYKRSQEFN